MPRWSLVLSALVASMVNLRSSPAVHVRVVLPVCG